ncbi:probable G-protein coupled receptor 139 [Mya arenaria]|uniref:probable G-protein coupled receptor 139 n=1 Tax=Mya arenaria TaxID=6604 RepID=UPI0022DFE90D|nr:probable G-protein coupled receptor 139 [Mya arenaria]
MDPLFETMVGYYLNLCLLTPVILFGLVGNCLSMLTWGLGCHRETSTAVLLTALAATDTIVLTMPALEMWAYEVLNYWLRLPNVVFCKIFAWASYFGPSVSSWIIVLITMERFVSIWFPMKVRYVCSRSKVRMFIVGVYVVLAIMYSPFLFVTDLRPDRDNLTAFSNTTCRMDRPNGTFFKYFFPVWMWLDMIVLFIVPFFFVVCGNILILYKLIKSRKIHRKGGLQASTRTKVANAFTIRAIAISISLLVCLFPVSIQEVYNAHIGSSPAGLVYVIVRILLYANSAFNFILYCAIGSGFRKDMKAVLMTLCTRKKVRILNADGNMSTHFSRVQTDPT